MRAAIQRGLDADLTPRESRVFDAVLALTASYSKTEDRVSARQVADMTHIDPRHVRRALRSLADKGVIGHVPGAAVPGEGNVAPLVSLTPDDQPGGPQTARGAGSVQTGQNPPARGANERPARGANEGQPGGPELRPPSEKYPEKKTSEKVSEGEPSPNGSGRRDELFEAVCHATGIDWHDLTPAGRGPLNRAVKELRDVGATPDAVAARSNVYRMKFPDAALTPPALAKHWASCDPQTAGRQLAAPPPDRQALRIHAIAAEREARKGDQ